MIDEIMESNARTILKRHDGVCADAIKEFREVTNYPAAICADILWRINDGETTNRSFRWEHHCSLDWLRERQKYLTASEIRSLIPLTKTGRPRTITDADKLKVYAGKMKHLTEDDCVSYGAAARGHILEPYAIHELNSVLRDRMKGDELFWWDDKLISDKGRSIAFSPDAMNVPMDWHGDIYDISYIAEVKSYSPEKHLVTAYAKKGEREERWQIATAMALVPTISYAYLVLYNPSIEKKDYRLFVSSYHRRELEEEINMICDVERDWESFVTSLPTFSIGTYPVGEKCFDEEEIVELVKMHYRLNP